MPRAPLLAALVLSLACDKPSASPTTAPDTASPTPATEPATTTTTTTTATPEPATAIPTEGKLVGLELGDRACYVHLESAGGSVSIEGDFELCAGGKDDARRLVGRTVIIATERANVLAASC